MNKIYKVVWSKVKNCYVVVSEIAKNVISGSVKSAKIGAAPVVKGMALGALMALVITGNAWAAGGYYNGHYYIFSNYKEFTENTSMSTWRALFTGDNEPGVYHTVNANGNTITLTGKISGSVPLNEYGFSYHGGIMRLYDASKIEFAGDYKSGIYAYVGNYAQFTDIGDIVQTSGSFSEGYFINNYGSTVEIDANNIDVNGGITSTYCDYTAQGVVYGTTDINVSENITLTGNINAYQQSTIDINANQSNITGDITSKSGSVVSITANTNNFTGNMHTEGENSRINITANSQGNVVGDVSALSGGGVSIDLAGSGSSFIGSSTTDDTNGGVVLDLTQGATWYVTGDSKVDSIIGDDFNIIAANGMKDINLTIECGNHNLDVDDYYDHTNSNLRGVNMFLVAPTEDGLTDGVSVNSDSDVTINSGEHGVAILNGGRVNVVADDVKIDSVKAAIWVDDPGTGIASITASGNVNLNSEQRFAVNNESKNNGVIEIVGNNVTIISEDRTAVKAGGILGREGKNGIVNINGNNIDIQGASQDDTYGNEHNASVVYAQGGTTINLSATGTLKVSDTEKIGGNTISVYEGGTINIKDTANVVVDGKVYANGEGSKVDIAASNVNLSDIVLVEDSGEINITGFTDITISNNDSSVYAIHANKGTVNITDDLNVNVNANSGSAYGIKASKDSDVNIGSAGKDISVTTTGKGDWSISTAFLADGVNSKINVVANNLTVNSQTDALYHAGRSLQAKKNGEINVVADNIELTGGINTDSDGRIDILGNTSISVSGKDNVSFSAVEAGSGDITITGNTNISANGSSLGVYSYGGDINIIGDTSILMETGDQRGYAIKSNGGHITIDGNTNVVANSDSDWVYAVTADGGNIKITDGLNAKITGDAAYGIEAKNSSNIEIGDAQSNIYISVIGMDNSNGYADAVYADNSNVEIVGDEVTITTSANGSLQQGIGLRATNNGTVNVEANTVDLTGRIIATNNGIVNVTGITTVSIEKEEGVGYAIQASGGNVQIADSVDVVVTGGAARGIEANDGAKIYLGGDGKDVSLSATATGASADAILVYGKDTEVDVKADKFTVNAIGTFSPYTGGYSSYSLQVKDGAIVDVDANTVNIAGSLYAGQYYGVQEANTAIIDLTEVGDIGIKSVLTNLAVQAEKEGMILVGSKDSKTNITGDITAFSGGSVNAVFGTKDSAFTGATKIGHEGDNKDGSIVLDFNDGATWYITEDSKVSSVIGDNFNIVAADGVNDVELTISGDHNFDIADYESTNVNIKGVDLIAIEPDGSGLSGNKTIISDSDVTFDVGKNGVYVSGSDKVSVNADNIMFNSVEDTILLQGNGEVSIKGSEEIVLNSKQGYVVNNDAENEGDITINGKTVTLISQDNGVVKSGNKVGNGSTYIGATNVTIEGSSNNQQSGVVHAQSGEIKIVGYDVSITDKEGDGYALLVDKETGAMEIGFTSGSTELSIDGDIKATEGSFKMTAGFDSVIRGSINTEDNSSSNVTLYGTTWYATGNSAMYRFRGNDSTIAVDLNKTDDIAIKNNYSTNTIVKATGVDLKGNAKEVLSGMDEKLRDIVTVESNIGNAEALTYKSAVIDTVLYGDVELSDGKVITNMDTDDVVVKGDVFAGNNTSIKGNANAIELLNTAVVGKANVSDVYTKTEVDTALVGKADRADISALDSQVEAFSTTRDEKGKVTGATITGIVNAHDFSAGNYTLRQVGSDLNTLDRLAIKNGQYMIDDRTDSLSMMSQSADRFYLTTENIDRTSYTSMGLEEGRFYISNHNIDGTASAELYVSGTKVGVNGDFVVSDWNGKKFTVASNGSVTGGTYNGVEIKNVNNNAVIGGINLSTLATQQDTEELQGNIDAEITNREVADIALESKVTEAYKSADEVLRSGYETADNALSGRINEAQASIALKANIADVYTKTVADAKFAVKASTLAGYGITDAYTQAEVNAKIADATSGLLTDANLTGKADKADTLSGYGIADAYTKDEVNAKIADATSGLLTDANLVGKADKADTLSGYGITDAYTKAEVDSEIVAMNASVTEAYKSADTELEGRVNTKLGEVENAYQQADAALEGRLNTSISEVEFAYKQADEVILGNIAAMGKAYTDADVALERRVTVAYENADKALKSGYEAADNALRDYIDQKVNGIVTDANVSDLQNKTQNITAEAGKTFVDGEINTDSLIASGNVVANGSVIGSSVVSTGNVEAGGDIITNNGDVKAGDVSLQNTANQVEANKVAIENVKTDLSAELDKKANASDVYTKDEVYTKAEADAIFVKQTAVKTEDEEGNTTITTDTVVKQNVVEVKDVDGNITTTTKTEIDNNFVVEGSDKGAEVSINKDTDSQVIIGADGKMIFGTNSTAIDKHGIYAGRIDETGDHDYANAKAAINDEGEVKAASGKFTVDKDGNVKATSYNGINLEQFVNNSQEAISGLNQRLGQMNGKINKVGAGAAALAALHPLEYDPDDKLTFSAGVGNYNGTNAAALGAFYRPDENLMFSLGGTMGNGENMVNLGVSIGLDGAKGTPKLSKKELIQIVGTMHEESKAIKAENDAIKAENEALEERVAKLEALVAKLAEK